MRTTRVRRLFVPLTAAAIGGCLAAGFWCVWRFTAPATRWAAVAVVPSRRTAEPPAPDIAPAEAAQVTLSFRDGSPRETRWMRAEPRTGAAVMHGIRRRHAADGAVQYELTYADGRQRGEGVFYYGDGRRAVAGDFRDGRRHGTVTTWHGNGQVAEVAEYVGGRLNGHVARWLGNGRKWEEGTYRDGRRHGRFSLWDAKGIETVVVYDHGKVVATP